MARMWSQIRALAGTTGEPVSAGHGCLAAARATGAFGASLSMARGAGLREPVFATDPRSEELGELQFTLGEGPGADTLNGHGPVLVTDLASADNGPRWPAFGPAAAGLGARGMFSFPVGVGAVRLGVLDLYRDRPGRLTGDELADALACADAVLWLTLDELGGIGARRRDFLDVHVDDRRAVVHQAAGMVSVQLDATVTDALARLRAHAYAHDRRLAAVAADVLARRLRFQPGTGVALVADTDANRADANRAGANSEEEPG